VPKATILDTLLELCNPWRAMFIADDDCPRGDDPGDVASVALSNLDEALGKVLITVSK
jgi:hypothetical protein